MLRVLNVGGRTVVVVLGHPPTPNPVCNPFITCLYREGDMYISQVLHIFSMESLFAYFSIGIHELV